MNKIHFPNSSLCFLHTKKAVAVGSSSGIFAVLTVLVAVKVASKFLFKLLLSLQLLLIFQTATATYIFPFFISLMA